ncbi:carbonic anhydrase family protein [Planktotalea sp.]|uniref:carbonic anhydrase family protein n=1 Tax=Planktotalea sp. TaxID=2029877 RepID=UPI003F6C231E
MGISRRNFFYNTVAATAVGLTATRAKANVCTMPTAERQASLTPQGVVDELMAGNARFVSGNMVNCDLAAQIRLTSEGQHPIAAIVGCIDSRVPPELVFDQNIGDIFTARVAGNFVNTDIIGSLEFACFVSGAKSIVVLGHTECGAVKGAVDQVELGNLTATLKNIEPAVAAAGPVAVRSSSDGEFVQRVADKNVAIAVQNILNSSEVLSGMVEAGELAIVGAMHDISTGKVTLM